MLACERAVQLAPDNASLLESRGIARALTGDCAGAVKDLDRFVTSAKAIGRSDALIRPQNAWIAELRGGQNPFDTTVLRRLRIEHADDPYARTGNASAAVAAYERATQLSIATDNGAFNNFICWNGSVDGFAAIVWPACKRAITQSPDDGSLREGHGLAAALTGDYTIAADDFEQWVRWARGAGISEDHIRLREEWISELSSGRNPFDAETLQGMRTGHLRIPPAQRPQMSEATASPTSASFDGTPSALPAYPPAAAPTSAPLPSPPSSLARDQVIASNQ
jgi:hypothetical protein